MAQSNYALANQDGASFRAALNAVLEAIATNNSGATEPAITYPYQWWPDVTKGLLKMRNASNDAWVTIGSLADIGIQSGVQVVADAGGTADAITASFSPSIAALKKGMRLLVLATTANATTTPTFTPNSGVIPQKTIIGPNGNSLSPGSISGSGHWLDLVYDLGRDKWVLQNPVTNASVGSNIFINGGMRVSQRGTRNVPAVGSLGYGGCDRWYGTSSGFTSFAGSLNQARGVVSSRSKCSQAFTVTTTGSGTILLGQRIEAMNSVALNGKAITISGLLNQDTGSAVNATVYVHKPSLTDNFGSLTQIVASSVINVPSGSGGTPFSFSTTLGASDATNGLQVSVGYSVGAVTGKTFHIAEMQLVEGANVNAQVSEPLIDEVVNQCRRYGRDLAEVFGSQYSTTGTSFNITFDTQMRVAPQPFTAAVTSASTVGVGPQSSLSSFSFSSLTQNRARGGYVHAAIGAAGQPVDINLVGFLEAEL